MLWAVLGTSLFGSMLVGAALGAGMGLTGLIVLHLFAHGGNEIAVLSVWNLVNNFTFSSVPIFILLGELLVGSGLSGRIYGAITPWFERVPGRLLHSNIVVSAMFGAVSGSSAATSASVGSVAYPELARRGYYRPSVAASIAAGGTLGLLIPPSLSLLIFGVWQEVSIGKLFLAGVFPGLLMAALFIGYILFDSVRRPNLIPAAENRFPMRVMAVGLLGLWPLVLLIASVLGPIYLGLATVTESAGLGTLVALVLGFTVGHLTLRRLFEAALSATASLAALSMVLVGAAILAQSVTILALPSDLVALGESYNLSKYALLAFVVVFFLVMGIFFDGISLMLTTVPFIYPLMVVAGFDPVWIGVFVTIMIEIGMLTPPIGVNLFVVLVITRQEVTLGELSAECLPYWFMLLVGTALITVFPQIVLFLPRVLL